MTKFKKGDRIIFVEDDHYFGGVEMPKGTLATYDDDRPASPTARVRLDTGERVIVWHDYIAHAEPPVPLGPGQRVRSWSDYTAPEPETSAPLNPAKVKVGDTVTLSSDGLGATVAGRVTDIQHDHGAWTIYLTLGVMGHSTPFVVGVGTVYTLIAHQPAPEPEPAVPEAQFGTAEVEPYGRLRGFLVYSATDRTFSAPLPGGGYTVISGEYVDDLAFTPDAPPYLVEWATEVDTLGTKEVWDSEAEAREMADRYGQRLFRVEWTEVR